MDTFEYDIHNKEVISHCNLNPTEILQEDTPWLWALNNKYSNDELDPKKIGKWMLFISKANVNAVWNKIKESIKDGHLWHSKVSTTNPSNSTHAIMIYTKDYTDLEDVINVLNYLETSGLKPANTVIRYKTDEQTRAGVYASSKQKASIYASDTIKLKYGGIQRNKLSWGPAKDQNIKATSSSSK